MPISTLIAFKPGKGLDTGVFPSAEDTVGGWGDARNAWFRELHIAQVPGQQKIVSTITRKSQAMAQAYVSGKKRLYFEDGGTLAYVDDLGSPQVIASLDTASTDYWFEPWGTWLVISDSVNQLKLWKGVGSGAPINIATGQFKTAKIIKKLAQHLIAYNTDVYPNGMHWCSASDPETWTPSTTNSARNLPIRNLDSDIIAVVDLAGGHAVYSRAYMMQVQYVGPNDWFGTPGSALMGIGAVSKWSVVSLGKFNWGISRGGVWLTDGSSFMYVDRPAVDRWVQEQIDWSRESEIVGWFDEKLLLVCWSVPLIDGTKSVLAVDPKDRMLLTDKSKRPFTFLTGDYGSALSREVMDYPTVASSDGIFYTSVSGTVMGDFYLQGGLFDAGTLEKHKTWEIARLEGTIEGAEFRWGFTDRPHLDTVEWLDWQAADYEINIPGGPRESIFMAFELKSKKELRVSGITILGIGAGSAT